MVWDRDCVNGSIFQECADVGIQHYENYSPATQTIGLHFIDCNMFNVGVITLGDRASEEPADNADALSSHTSLVEVPDSFV